MVDGQQSVGSYFVDIVMCIDGTGSMSPIIKEVKENALSFYEKFVEKMEDANKSVDNLRIKVITFRDYISDSEPMVVSKGGEDGFFSLPSQNDAFREYVNAIEATGGGDGPENALEAIALALKSNWTTGGDNRRHVILVFTDAPALKLGERADCASYPKDLPSDLAELGAWWEGSQQLDCPYQIKAGRLVVFGPDAYPWNELQSWNRYWTQFSKAGTGLTEIDIQTVIDLLVGSIGGPS